MKASVKEKLFKVVVFFKGGGYETIPFDFNLNDVVKFEKEYEEVDHNSLLKFTFSENNLPYLSILKREIKYFKYFPAENFIANENFIGG